MAKDKLLSVKEVAEMAGVSVQAIYKRMDKDFKPYVVEVENKKCLKYSVLKLFSFNHLNQKVEKNPEIETFKKLVEILENENAAKQKTIDMLNLKLDEEHANLIELTKQVGSSLQVITQTNLADKLIEGEHLTREEPQDVPVPATAPGQAPTKKSWKWWK